jgi:hypothetical protein
VLGRFLSADTLVPSPNDPQSLNRFAYTNNNPLNYADPSGHAADAGGAVMTQSNKKALVAGLLGVVLVFILFVFAQLKGMNVRTGIVFPSIVTLKPLATWSDEMIVKSDELPSGWRLGRFAWDDVLGTPSRSYSFKHLPAAPIGTALSEEFVVYSTTVMAEQAYPQVTAKFFPSAYGFSWKTMPDLAFQDHADELKTACLPGEQFNGSPNMACSSIARYQNVIVQVNGFVHPDQWLTLSDFRQMLEAVDQRVAWVLSR